MAQGGVSYYLGVMLINLYYATFLLQNSSKECTKEFDPNLLKGIPLETSLQKVDVVSDVTFTHADENDPKGLLWFFISGCQYSLGVVVVVV